MTITHIIIKLWILIVLLFVSIPRFEFADAQKGEQYAQYEENQSKRIISMSKSQEKRDSKSKRDDKSIKEKTSSSNITIIYKPPRRGAPRSRVGGGKRGNGLSDKRGMRDDGFTVLALVPEGVGFTVNKEPSLFWYLSEETPYPIELTVIEYKAIKPLIEKRLPPSVHPGINRIRLADYGIHLKEGVVYQWFVSIVPDPDHRSRDIIAGGAIERMDITEALHSKLAKANRQEVPHIYAEEGLWYDSLSAISDLIDSAPNDQELKTIRASLLKQVGLGEIASH